jgi:hypothetical protein
MPQSNFRVLRHTHTLHVQPSLRINAFTRPSARALNEFILGIEIENLLSTPVVLNQLSALSARWIVKAVDKDRDGNSIPEIQPQQTVYLYYRFSREGCVELRETPESIVSNAIERVVVTENEKVVISPPPLGVLISTLLLVHFY